MRNCLSHSLRCSANMICSFSRTILMQFLKANFAIGSLSRGHSIKESPYQERITAIICSTVSASLVHFDFPHNMCISYIPIFSFLRFWITLHHDDYSEKVIAAAGIGKIFRPECDFREIKEFRAHAYFVKCRNKFGFSIAACVSLEIMNRLH